MGLFSSKPDPAAEEREAEERREERRKEKEREEFWPQYLHKSKILESWSAMIDGGKGKADQFTDNVGERLTAADIPDLQVEVRTMHFDSERKQQQDFVVLWRNVSPLHVCKMFIGRKDVGENLSVAWYLLWDDGKVWDEWTGDNGGKILYDFIFNVGNERELKDWVKIVHLIILDETKQLMTSLNLDSSKVDVHTRGFLNLP